KNFFEELEKNIVRRAIRSVYRTYESAHRLEIESFKEALFDDPSDREQWVNLNYLSNSFDIREIIILFQEIKLKAKVLDLSEATPYLFSSPYSTINSIYNRIHELRYRGNVNYSLLLKLVERQKLEEAPDELRKQFRTMLVNPEAWQACERLF